MFESSIALDTASIIGRKKKATSRHEQRVLRATLILLAAVLGGVIAPELNASQKPNRVSYFLDPESSTYGTVRITNIR
jgi:hypothetical protein